MCVCVHIQREYISLWAGVFTIFWCLCWFDLGLIACGNSVVHAHITYVLKSCCFSLSNLLSSLSAALPSVPFSPLICTPSPLQRGLCVGPRGRRRLARRRTSLRGSNVRLDLWSSSTNTHCPWRTVSQHASACTGTHRQSHTHLFVFPTQSPLLTLPPFTFHFLRSCLFPSVRWCLRRWHLLLLLLLSHSATWRPPITGLFLIARALRWPITGWFLSCGPTP